LYEILLNFVAQLPNQAIVGSYLAGMIARMIWAARDETSLQS
jgi:hypothetical protein